MLNRMISRVTFAARALKHGDLPPAGKHLHTHWKLVARDPTGKIKWVEEFDNLVVDDGLDDSLDKHLKGSSYTAAWYIGLTDGTPSFAAADDMTTHAGWVEVTAYSQSNRVTCVFGTVSSQSVDNSASPASFTINADDTTIGGAFLCSDNTKGGTSGILYGGAAFSAGDKTLDTNDVLEVTVTCTASAS